ncbi:GM12964 [Drosophila sechellia]|uniref:GM12964 n=1 Tax=Drosophila sechellia TaxID=7238 RepID=B4INU3_DROSE|nr:GM12964 [Drosophila sechellia]
MEYGGICRTIFVYLCSYLEQAAYFGIDVWQANGQAPSVVSGIVPKSVNEAAEIHVRQWKHCANLEEIDEAKEKLES